MSEILEEQLTETLENVAVVKHRTPSLEVLIEHNGLRSLGGGELIKRAIAVGYVKRLPKSPVLSSKVLNPEEHQKIRNAGYRKRMSNWLRGLITLEIEKGVVSQWTI